MAYELFRISGSPFAWRASLALMIKGLDYEDRLLDAGKREHKEPWYLALNPRGKVPVLKDGDTVVCESAAIMAYLDARHPEPPLFGKSAGQSARIAQLASEILNYL
ncbi:MAG: glutathione S-transferase family protein, partial [Paracoccaceae bacterium]